jgi:glycosyltransferase involved in cell wall biosynthesis
MTQVLYTGAFRFPDGDAAALRVSTVGDLFERAGCTVSFAGWEACRPEGVHYVHADRDCYSQSEFREQPRSPLGRLSGFLLRGAKTLRWLARNWRFDVIVAYNPPALFALGLLLMARWRRARVVLDSTEWYESEHLPGGKYGLAALENWVRMHVVYPLFSHVICISRLLEQHFAGRNVINIPPISGVTFDYEPRPEFATGVFFVYAGDAGKKDRLLPFIQALPSLQVALQRPVRLRIAGLEQEVLRALMLDSGMDDNAFWPHVECLGRLQRDGVLQLYRASHFSVLFREDKRYAKAGFPTKAVESWVSGCPIIANPVGDLGALASHMMDAILVDESELSTRLPAALKSIIESGQYPRMSTCSQETAARLFAPAALQPSFASFARRLGLPPQRSA